MTMNIIKTAENLIDVTEQQLRTDEAIHNIRPSVQQSSDRISAPIFGVWIDINSSLPIVKAGDYDHILITVERETGKRYAYEAVYLNAYPLDGDIEFEAHVGEGNFTGFAEINEHHDYNLFFSFIGGTDKVTHWMPKPVPAGAIAATQVAADHPSDAQILEQCKAAGFKWSSTVSNSRTGDRNFYAGDVNAFRVLLVSNAGKASSDQIAQEVFIRRDEEFDGTKWDVFKRRVDAASSEPAVKS